MFQFLIGTVKTNQNAARGHYVATFQFLIGTVKTKVINGETVPIEAFQFLIGTVKTIYYNQKERKRYKSFNSS